MAPESLTEMVFSSQSDVWSFGVVMWELFSFGKVPYPGIDVSRLIRELLNGYRMEKPQYVTNEIGRLMVDCWKMEPKERPTFNQLQEALGNHLESSLRHHYLEMSQSYLQLKDELQSAPGIKKKTRLSRFFRNHASTKKQISIGLTFKLILICVLKHNKNSFY